MRIRWTTILGVALAASACSEVPRPGRCDQTSDCTSMSGYAGYICNLDPTPQGNGRCVPMCNGTPDCQGGRVCDFDSHGVGRCLFPEMPDGGGDADGSAVCSACAGSTPVCVGGTCVQCATSADCTTDSTTPICDTTSHACRACTSDSECAVKLGANPGVCMAHQDGHCATDAETVYVENKTGCMDTTVNDQGGTSAVPFCSMGPVQTVVANSDVRTLVLVRGTVNAATSPFQRNASRSEVSVLGQQDAFIAAGAQPGLEVQGGRFFVRGLKISAAASIGVTAVSGNPGPITLRLDTVTVDSCQKGGILLDGAAFDIRNAVVRNNGPGDMMGTAWGGIRVSNPPAGGPKQLELVTLANNKQVGLTCTAGIIGTGVLATGSSGGIDISPTCGVTPCSAAGPTCGATQ